MSKELCTATGCRANNSEGFLIVSVLTSFFSGPNRRAEGASLRPFAPRQVNWEKAETCLFDENFLDVAKTEEKLALETESQHSAKRITIPFFSRIEV